MSIEAPGYLPLLACVPLACYLSLHGARASLHAIARVAGERRAPAFREAVLVKRTASGLALAVAAALMSLAAVDLRWGTVRDETLTAGHDIAVLLDASYSMRAADVAPSRLGIAAAFLRRVAAAADGAQFGLTIFRGRPLDLLPVTGDRTVLKRELDRLIRELTPAPRTAADVVPPARAAIPLPPPGSDIEFAVRASLAIAALRPSVRHTLILLTDGESSAPRRPLRQAELAGATVVVALIGTEPGVALLRPDGTAVVDSGGQPVTTRAVRARVEGMTRTSHGLLVQIAAISDLDQAVEDVVAFLRTISAEESAGPVRDIPRSRTSELMLAASAAALAASLIRSTRWRGSF